MHLNNWFKFLRKNSDDTYLAQFVLLNLDTNRAEQVKICLMFHFSYVNPDPELFPRFRFICFRSCKKKMGKQKKIKAFTSPLL